MSYRLGDIELDPASFRLSRGSEELHLEPQPLRILIYLIEHRERVISKEELVVFLEKPVADAALESAISAIRRHTGKTAIRTRHRLGYQYVGPVEAAGASLQRAVPAISSPADSVEVRRFFTGGPTTPNHIALSLDVPRTQYARDWVGQDGRPERAWQHRLLARIDDSDPTPRLVVLYGHSGSGKTTLCYRMMHDLLGRDVPVFDSLDGVQGLPSVSDLPRTPNHRPHLYTSLRDLRDGSALTALGLWLRTAAKAPPPITLYLAVDTNKWRQVSDRIHLALTTLHIHLEDRHLRGQLDEEELRDLVERLRRHDALFRRRHKDDEALAALLRFKAKRDLLASLIEITRGSEETADLESILVAEHLALPERARWIHALVSLCTARRIGLPAHLLHRLTASLTGEAGYYRSPAFVTELAEMLHVSRGGTWRSRHWILADSLLKRLAPQAQPMFVHLLSKLLRVSALRDEDFFEALLDRKVPNVLADLTSLAEEMQSGSLKSLEAKSKSKVLNSMCRIAQGRHKRQQALRLAEESLARWNHRANPAFFLRGFTLRDLGDLETAKAIGWQLLELTEFPHHVLHGAALLRLCGAMEAANLGLRRFREIMGDDAEFHPEYRELSRDISALTIRCSERELQTVRPSLALEYIETVLPEHATEAQILAEYRALIERQPDFRAALVSFSAFAFRAGHEAEDPIAAVAMYEQVADLCSMLLRQHDEALHTLPKDVRAILLCARARALFLADRVQARGFGSEPVYEEDFWKSLQLNPRSAWAHNWYATFLKDAKGDLAAAEGHYVAARRLEPENAVFCNNMALLLYDRPVFSRAALERARALASEAVALAQAHGHASFGDYPSELLERIRALLARADLAEGQPLEPEGRLAASPVL